MDKKQTDQIIHDLMVKIGDGPDSYSRILADMATNPVPMKEFQKIITDFTASMDTARLLLKYLAFDLDITRRERDELRRML